MGAAKKKLPTAKVIELKKGQSLRSFSQELTKVNLVEDDIKFEAWVRLFSDYSHFQAGPYRFQRQASPLTIANKIIKGKIYRPVVFKVTIPEGFTYRQFTQKLIHKGIGQQTDYQELFSNEEFLKELNIPSKSLEGFIYPATYSFLHQPSPKDVIRKAVRTFWHRLPTDYTTKLKAFDIDLKKAVTIASLIELETPQAHEKPLISEVIWRRLKSNMPLGIDSAIIYGIKDYQGNITKKHLQDTSNPYNTRIHLGLPPSPIGSPDLNSLLAVITPSNEGNYYFVVDPQHTKQHIFAKTLREHNQNVRNYVSALRQKNLNNKGK